VDVLSFLLTSAPVTLLLPHLYSAPARLRRRACHAFAAGFSRAEQGCGRVLEEPAVAYPSAQTATHAPLPLPARKEDLAACNVLAFILAWFGRNGKWRNGYGRH